MHEDLSLNDYLERLNARDIDPNEFVAESGKLVRAARRREAKQRHRTKNRKNELTRVTTWKGKNPDKVDAQRNREADRNYHRPFIAVDAEGQDFPGFDEVDTTFMATVEEALKAGLPEPQKRNPDGTPASNVYPLHRTILWAAGGWKRSHTSTELVAGIGKPTLGEECPAYFLYHDDKPRITRMKLSNGCFLCQSDTNPSRLS